MNHRRKPFLFVVLALMLMAAGAGLVLSALRLSPDVGRGEQSPSSASPAPAAPDRGDVEPSPEPALILGWDGTYTLNADSRLLLLQKRLLPEKACLQPDFAALYEEVCFDASDASFSTDGSHTIIPEKPGLRFDTDDARKR